MTAELQKIKDWIEGCWSRVRFGRRQYRLRDVFGCGERPSKCCPTYFERKVHRKFQTELRNFNIVVVYGESRQGKTWMVDRYCPNQIRVGCNSAFTLNGLKKQMVQSSGTKIRNVSESYSSSSTAKMKGGVGVKNPVGIEIGGGTSETVTKTTSSTSLNVNIDNQDEFLNAIKRNSRDRVFIFDNFHYLSPKVQQEFCALLKELNYHDIRVVIIGVWRDASKITALAPDLVNRCAQIDVGAWTDEELKEVLRLGESALNVEIPLPRAGALLRDCAQNIGIFKDLLNKFCISSGIEKTSREKVVLGEVACLKESIKEVMEDAATPLHDRLMNLALPLRDRKDSKQIRLKIVICVLELLIRRHVKIGRAGILLSDIHDELDKFQSARKDDAIGVSNLTQELGCLHLREENRQTDFNFIPIFYFDKVNKKLLVIEPTVYALLNYRNGAHIKKIIKGLKGKIRMVAAS